MLAEQGILADLIEKDMNPKSCKDENSVHENGTGSNANSSSSKKNSNSKVKSGNNNSSSSTTKNKVGRPKLTNKSRRKWGIYSEVLSYLIGELDPLHGLYVDSEQKVEYI